MPEKTLDALRKSVQTARGISYAKKAELLNLIQQLQNELNSKNQDNSVKSGTLKESISEFETEHPDLVELTNRACKMLSDIGI